MSTEINTEALGSKKAMRQLLSTILHPGVLIKNADEQGDTDMKGKPLIECVYDFVRAQPAGCTIFYIVKNQELLKYEKSPTFASISSVMSVLKRAGIVESVKNVDNSSTFKVVGEYSKSKAYKAKVTKLKAVAPKYARLDTLYFIVIRTPAPTRIEDWVEEGPGYIHLIAFDGVSGPVFETNDALRRRSVLMLSTENDATILYEQLVRWYGNHQAEVPNGLRIAYAG